MRLRTALTFGSPSSIRLISDATARPSPLRICFVRLIAISETRERLEQWSSGVMECWILINHHSIPHYSITPFPAAIPSRSPSVESLKFPRQSHRFWHHESIVPQDSL